MLVVPIHEEISVQFHSEKLSGRVGGGNGGDGIAIIELALGPDLET